MEILLVIAFLFFIGSCIGWGIEVLYRRFISDSNPERKWINPGFLVGPYLPLYGFSLASLFLMSLIPVNFIKGELLQKLFLFVIMSVVITFIEYIAGLIFIKGMKIKLWDYSNEWCNFQGIICPKYTLYWMMLSAIYYFIIHPQIIDAVYWLTQHLMFSFVIGFFYGLITVDFFYSMKIMAKIRAFARENRVEVRLEEFKSEIRRRNEEHKAKISFILAIKAEESVFVSSLKGYLEREKEKRRK